MFGFIKNLLGGILGFFGKLFGFKKSEYYVDLGGDDKSESAKPAKSAPVATQSLNAPKAKPAPAPKTASAVASTTFAASSVISTNTPRRRPGANMTSYLNMARQVRPSR